MNPIQPYFILAEDDPVHARNLQKKLLKEFAGCEIKRLKTEHEFQSSLDEFGRKPPDVIVLDVMLSWTQSTAQMADPPKEVSEGGYHRAGFRCIKLLADNETTQKIPCIVYTVLARSALEAEFNELPQSLDVEYLQKESEPTRLINLIRRLYRNKHSRLS